MARRRLRDRLRYLWRDLDPAGVELLSAGLSLWFALILVWPRDDPRNGPRPLWGWALLACAAGACKVVGVVTERVGPRAAGLALGAGFWASFALVFALTVQGGVTWGVYLVLAGAQLWALWRVVRP